MQIERVVVGRICVAEADGRNGDGGIGRNLDRAARRAERILVARHRRDVEYAAIVAVLEIAVVCEAHGRAERNRIFTVKAVNLRCRQHLLPAEDGVDRKAVGGNPGIPCTAIRLAELETDAGRA